MSRASVQETHNLILPVFDRALREILRQEGFSPDVRLQLGDYIGNKLEFDQNIRENFAAKLIPQEEAVMMVNNLSVSETAEYMEKLKADAERLKETAYGGLFNEKDYFGDQSTGGES